MMSFENNNHEKRSTYIQDLKKWDILIRPPCINLSKDDFSIERSSDNEVAIRYSVSALKNVGTDSINQIVSIRSTKGQFIDMDDFLNKIPYSLLTKKTFESLIKAGAFDCLENNRNKLLNSIDIILIFSQALEKEKLSNQHNLFNTKNNNELLLNIPETSDFSFDEKLNNEFSSLGLY